MASERTTSPCENLACISASLSFSKLINEDDSILWHDEGYWLSARCKANDWYSRRRRLLSDLASSEAELSFPTLVVPK